MCGISGTLKLHGGLADSDQLWAMISTLAHRGPDAHAVYCSGSVGLAHSRLSIVDLEGGAQPMSIADGTLWITFNGEIFNYLELREELIGKEHQFRTRSDTEVILHLYQEYGDQCVHRMNGQWSFAIWDAQRRRLFASRDRMGVRPLFYTQTRDAFLFASEMKALLACQDVVAELDYCGLDQIFTFWVTVPPRTVFKNICQLPPGHCLAVEDGRVRSWRYWNLEYGPDASSRPEKALAQDLLELLLDATRIRLRADVPVGAYLSGGLDSTVIAALTHLLVGDRLRTFSVSFEDAAFDESAYQLEASSFLHTRHTSACCTCDDIATVFPEVIRHTEQPILRTAPAPLFLLSRLVRQNGYKVVLTGEGADEVLGGYDIFKEAKIRRFIGTHPDSRWRPLLLKRLYPYLAGIQHQPAAYLQRFFQVSPDEFESPFFSHLPRWELTARLKMFFTPEAREAMHSSLASLEENLPASFSAWHKFNQAEYLEAMYLLPGYILSSQGDRMAMAHSVEGRYPFLDHRVVSFAAQLHPNSKMKVLNQKYLLKRATDGMIPASIKKRYKQPYRAPDSKSFVASSPEYLNDLLCEAQLKSDGVFQPSAVTALLQKFSGGRTASQKDDMAMVGILSTQLLVHEFIRDRKGWSTCKTTSQPMCVASS